MGKASRRKRDRRRAGFNQHALKTLRQVLNASREHGGMVRMAMGAGPDGVSHYVALVALEPPTTICAAEPKTLTPSNDEKPSCPLCAAIKEKTLQDYQWDLATANMAAVAETEEILRRLGG